MGYEYKIIAKFTDKQTSNILKLLEQDENFDKKYKYAGKELIEFRHIENQGKIPNLFITFEEDGLYVCQNESSYLWKYLDNLKKYIETEQIDYKILDYSD